jgi:hypothetical protein
MLIGIACCGDFDGSNLLYPSKCCQRIYYVSRPSLAFQGSGRSEDVKACARWPKKAAQDSVLIDGGQWFCFLVNFLVQMASKKALLS